MLKKIEIQNIQYHEKLIIQLKPGLNVIKGSNNHGKSTIIRSIYWVFTNRPLGDWMIKDGSDLSKIKIWIDDNIISRIKGKRKNLYRINDETFNDVATSIPQEVIKTSSFRQLNIANTKIFPNIGTDDELLFGVNFVGKVKYGIIAYLTGCDIINNLVRDYNIEKRQLNSRKSYIEEELSKINEKLVKMKRLKEIEDSLEVCERVKANYVAKGIKIEKMLALKNNSLNLQRIIGLLNIFAKNVDETLSILDVNIYDKIEQLLEAKRKIFSFNIFSQKCIDLVKNIELIKVIGDKCIEKWEKIEKMYFLFVKYARTKEDILFHELELKGITKKLSRYNVCPLCGNKMNV